MAKALYGHMAVADQRLLAEVARLRARVRELEDLVEELELARELAMEPIAAVESVDFDQELSRVTV
jgi:hypothetical protein